MNKDQSPKFENINNWNERSSRIISYQRTPITFPTAIMDDIPFRELSRTHKMNGIFSSRTSYFTVYKCFWKLISGDEHTSKGYLPEMMSNIRIDDVQEIERRVGGSLWTHHSAAAAFGVWNLLYTLKWMRNGINDCFKYKRQLLTVANSSF